MKELLSNAAKRAIRYLEGLDKGRVIPLWKHASAWRAGIRFPGEGNDGVER